MEPTIVVAAIGTVGTIVAAWIGARWSKKSEEIKAAKVAEGIGKAESIEHSYRVFGSDASLSFDEFGSGEYKRRVTGLVPRQTVTNLRIPYSFAISCPGGRLGEPEARELPESELPVTLDELEKADTQVKGVIRVNGTCAPDVRAEGFEITQPFEHGCWRPSGNAGI